MATYLGISEHTVRRYVRDERIPTVRIGRRVLFDLNDIDRWVRNGASVAKPQNALVEA